MSKKSSKKFNALGHENLKSRQALLEYAHFLTGRKGFENHFTAAMIYADFAEYIAKNLLENLRFHVYRGTHAQYTGLLFVDEMGADDRSENLQKRIKEIKKFNFSDKDGIVECLHNISEARNNIFHHLSELNIENLEKAVAENFLVIQNEVGDLADRVDAFYACLRKVTNQGQKNFLTDHMPKEEEGNHKTEEDFL